MKNRTFIKLAGVALVAIASGCSTVAHYKTDDYLSVSTKKIPASEIEVYSTDKIGRKYKVIGGVVSSADAGTNASISVELLKKEASKLGADAIINLRLAIDYGYWQNAIKATGTAITFKE